MPCTGVDAEVVRKQLDRILCSPGFANNERLSRFVRFVVERQLEGKAEQLKESLVGVEVFGRLPGFDTRLDSVVRTEAAKLRARLAEYYLSQGAADPVLIQLPKGGYAPVFREIEVTPEPPAVIPVARTSRLTARSTFVAALAVVAIIVGASRLSWFSQDVPIPIAVLPLVNLSQDPANEYFADGLTDELIRNLSILDGITVRSRTSSFAFKGTGRDIRDVGHRLQADYVLEGSVLRAGQHVRINVQLIRVRDDAPVWSHESETELTDIFAIQEDISRGIVNGLRLKLGRGRRRYETSTEAYDLYLRARALGPADGVDAFEQAIAKDPGFAPAWAGLAAARGYRSGLFRLDAAVEVPKMREAAEKALLLDPMLAEAHNALAIAGAREALWAQTEQSFRRATELCPKCADIRHDYALFLLWPLNRTAEAIEQLRLAERADPLSPDIQRALAYVLPSAGLYEEAARHGERIPADHPQRSYYGRAIVLSGKTAEGIRVLEDVFRRGATPGAEVRAFLGYAYALTGRPADAERMTAGTNPFNEAVIYAGLGDRNRALEAMERSTAAGPFRVGRQFAWPELALIRDDPRMKSLRKKVGLPQ
jgi:TolB-like protein